MSEVWRVRLRMTLPDQVNARGEVFSQTKTVDVPVEEYPTARAAERKVRSVLKKMFTRCTLRRKSVRRVKR